MDTAKKPEIKLSKSGRIRFTAGFFVCAILWMTGLAIVSAVLLPQHLRDIAGEAASTTIFGYVNAATAIASLVANLLFGNLSDRTRSRFGRRTPWIFWGAILAGVTLFLIGVVDNAWLIGIIYCVCMFGLNMMLAPVIATLSDRVPDDMRATMSAFNSAGTTVGSSLGTLIGAKFITIQIPGFATAGILMGLAGIATIVVWPQEQSSKDLHQSRAALRNSWPHSVLQCTTRVTFGWPSPDGRC